jgi:hypothetical protein
MQSTKTNCLGFKRIEGVPICFDYVTKRRSSRCQVIMSAQISTSTWQLLYNFPPRGKFGGSPKC